MTPPGRGTSASDTRERRRRKRRVASDSESGRRGGGRSAGSGNEGGSRSGSGRNSRGSKGGTERDIRDSLPTNFRAAISEFAPPLPPALQRKLEIKEVNGLGKVSVVICRISLVSLVYIYLTH